MTDGTAVCTNDRPDDVADRAATSATVAGCLGADPTVWPSPTRCGAGDRRDVLRFRAGLVAIVTGASTRRAFPRRNPARTRFEGAHRWRAEPAETCAGSPTTIPVRESHPEANGSRSQPTVSRTAWAAMRTAVTQRSDADRVVLGVDVLEPSM